MPTPYFAFIDESGVLENDPSQRFFALALLMLRDTARLHYELVDLHSRAVGMLNQAGTMGAHVGLVKSFEFKFANITGTVRPFYEKLIDVVLSFGDVRVCVFVIDKQNPKVSVGTYFRSTWDAYLSYAALVIGKNFLEPDACVVLADYITKPRNSQDYLEHKLCQVPSVVNAATLESKASVLIQAADVLAGAVVYSFKLSRVAGYRPNRHKAAVSAHLARSLNQASLAADLTVTTPTYFSVWEFQP